MRNSRRLYWGFQFIGWCAYSALIFLATYNDAPEEITIQFLIQLVNLSALGILCTHAMRAVFIRLGWLDLRLVGLIPRVAVVSFICSVIIALGMTTLGQLIEPKAEPLDIPGIIINVFAIAVLVLMWNAIYFTYHFFQKSRKQELNNLSLEASKNEIELKNLRSQLNPHFLFNSLNSIRALIDLDPGKAKHSVTTLSNLLRKSLLMGKEDLVTVETELEMVSHYLELEKVRFEERLTVLWDIDDRLNQFMIPPFCLQMLVENAIKHGISNMVEGGEIKISSTKEEGAVVIRVENTGLLSGVTDTGIGIVNTRRRLDIQYKGRAEFTLAQDNKYVVATLIFKDENVQDNHHR